MKNPKTQVLKSKRLALVLALAIVATLGSGCGQQAYNENSGDGSGTTQPQGGSGGGGTTPNPQPTPITTNNNGSPNYSFHFKVAATGNASQIGGGALSVSTDTVLKIAVTAGDGLQLPNSGFTIGFNCEKFVIKVGNVTQTAFVKKQNYTDYPIMYGFEYSDPCQGADTTWIGDFSGALSAGHKQAYTITINGAQYDNCRKLDLNGVYYYQTGTPAVEVGGCPFPNLVYSTHSVDGYLQAFTD